MTGPLPGRMTGSHRVRALREAFQDAHHWLPKARPRGQLRRHSLKLRFWPDRHPEDDNGVIVDLNWSWIKALAGKKVGELRIDDIIGGRDNLRVIFFDPQRSSSVSVIWILAILQKKRDDFTHAQISNFKLRRQIVLERFYSGP